MTARREQVEKALALMGNTHSFEDILDMIDSGAMQSFSDGDTWAITQVVDMPQKRVLEVFLVVGTLEGMQTIEPAVMDFAKHIGADMVRAFGRDGFLSVSKGYGWRNGQRLYLKELH
jgi:hypothetical protein